MRNEYSYRYGTNADKEVKFYFCNVKTLKTSEAKRMTYTKALELGVRRSMDRRYRNYEYLIEA